MMDILGDISRMIKLKQGKTKALLGIGGSSQMQLDLGNLLNITNTCYLKPN